MQRCSALALSLLLGCTETPLENDRERAEPHVAETAPLEAEGNAAPVDRAPVAGNGADGASAKRGRRWLEHFECNRCHTGPGLAQPPKEKQCVGCHEDILEGRLRAPADALAEWRRNIRQLREAPSLDQIGALLDPEWVASYLMLPYDQRPGLGATMPRLPMNAAQARDIAAFFAEESTSSPPTAQRMPTESVPAASLEEGKALFEVKGCDTCHAFEHPARWQRLKRQPPDRGARLAPDLRFTRQRFRRQRLSEWIQHPQSLRPATPMPDQGLSRREATALAHYIADAPLPEPIPIRFERLPPLERNVAYAEVEARIFRKLCWHCHAQPDLARGDGGPGMSGGFGFEGRKLDLSTYAAILSGYEDASGNRVSAFRPSASGTPLLVAVLLARRNEEAGAAGELRGMPLGFPSLPPEDIQLLESWIDQGRPQ